MKKALLSVAAGLVVSVMATVPAFAAGYHYVSGSIGSHVLSQGDHGPSVTTLQGDLAQFGFLNAVNGYFGPRTLAGLQAFQRAKGLSVTGTLDKATFEAILQEGGWSAPWTAGSGSGASGSSFGNSGSRSTSSGSSSGNSGSRSTSSGGSGAGLCGLGSTGRRLNLTATAYAPTAQDNYPYGAVDYYGRPLKAGDVAVDPRVIPLGTHLWVTGYSSPYLPKGGFCAIADDTGGAIKGLRIDLFINASESQVNSFGIQHVTATILK